jgi:hypothetical protein
MRNLVEGRGVAATIKSTGDRDACSSELNAELNSWEGRGTRAYAKTKSTARRSHQGLAAKQEERDWAKG